MITQHHCNNSALLIELNFRYRRIRTARLGLVVQDTYMPNKEHFKRAKMNS